MSDVDELSKRLGQLAERTALLGARPGFPDRVMLAVGDSALASGLELLRSARRLLPLALVAALVSTVWAVQSEQSSNQALATSDPPSQELDW